MDDFTVLEVHVTQWNLDPLTGGVYSTLAVGGTPQDRRQLGQPISRRLVFAGEYVSTDYPATMHGAHQSGEFAASHLRSADMGSVVVIGAGISGLIAAQRLQAIGKSVIVLEATAQIGGRARTEKRFDGAAFHPGAAWIHGTIGNPIAEAAQSVGVRFEPWPSSTEAVIHARQSVGRLSADQTAEVEAAVLAVEQQLLQGAEAQRQQGSPDVSLRGPLRLALMGIPDPTIRAAVAVRLSNHYESLMAALLDDFSFQHGNEPFAYPGGDAYVVSPLAPIIEVFSEGLDIRLGRQVHQVSYSETSVRIETTDGESLACDACVVAVPLGPLQSGAVSFDPPLPTAHLDSLSKLRMGEKAKVFVQFSSKWWGDAEQLFLYPDAPLDDPTQVGMIGTWVDATKLTGVPMLCGFVGGVEAIRLQHLSAAAEADPPDQAAIDDLTETVTQLLSWARLPRQP